MVLPILSTLLFAEPALALQVVDASDGQTALAKISRQEVTRIAFERSRVLRVTGNSGEFLLEKDDERGQIFIRPSDPLSNKPVNLFLNSAHGTVALLLQPVDLPGDTIIIRETQSGATRRSRLEASGHHVRVLKNLLVAIADDRLPEDMQLRELTGPATLAPSPWPDARLGVQRRLIGAELVAERLKLINLGDAVRELDEAKLYQSGVMAVALEQTRLQPAQATNVFIIRERRSDD